MILYLSASASRSFSAICSSFGPRLGTPRLTPMGFTGTRGSEMAPVLLLKFNELGDVIESDDQPLSLSSSSVIGYMSFHAAA